MIMFKDFENEDGDIDWKAYNRARIEAGEICHKCGQLIIWQKNSGLDTCAQCDNIKTDAEIDHDYYVRCPYCGDCFNPDDTGEYDLFSEGEHDVTCYVCDKNFIIHTHVSWSFTSPSMKKEDDEENEQCNQEGDSEIQKA